MSANNKINPQNVYLDQQVDLGVLNYTWIKASADKPTFAEKEDLRKIRRIFLAQEMQLTDAQKSAAGMSLVGRFFYNNFRSLYAKVCKTTTADAIKIMLKSYVDFRNSAKAEQIEQISSDLIRSKSNFLTAVSIQEKVSEVVESVQEQNEARNNQDGIRSQILAKLYETVKGEVERKKVPLKLFQIVFNSEKAEEIAPDLLDSKKWVRFNQIADALVNMREFYFKQTGVSENSESAKQAAESFINRLIEIIDDRYDENQPVIKLMNDIQKEHIDQAKVKIKERVTPRFFSGILETDKQNALAAIEQDIDEAMELHQIICDDPLALGEVIRELQPKAYAHLRKAKQDSVKAIEARIIAFHAPILELVAKELGDSAALLKKEYDEKVKSEIEAISKLEPFKIESISPHIQNIHQHLLGLLKKHLEHLGKEHEFVTKQLEVVEESIHQNTVSFRSESIRLIETVGELLIFIYEYKLDLFDKMLNSNHLKPEQGERSQVPSFEAKFKAVELSLSREYPQYAGNIKTSLASSCATLNVAGHYFSESESDNITKSLLLDYHRLIHDAFDAKRAIVNNNQSPRASSKNDASIANHKKKVLEFIENVKLSDIRKKIELFKDFLIQYHTSLGKRREELASIERLETAASEVIAKAHALSFPQLLKDVFGDSVSPHIPVPAVIHDKPAATQRTHRQKAPRKPKGIPEWEEIMEHQTIPSYVLERQIQNIMLDGEKKPRADVLDKIAEWVGSIKTNPKEKAELIATMKKNLAASIAALPVINHAVVATSEKITSYDYPATPILIRDLPHIIELWTHSSYTSLSTLLGKMQWVKTETGSLPLSLIVGYLGRLFIKKERFLPDFENLLNDVFRWVRKAYTDPTEKKQLLGLLEDLCQKLEFPFLGILLSAASLGEGIAKGKIVDKLAPPGQYYKDKLAKLNKERVALEAKHAELLKKQTFEETLTELNEQPKSKERDEKIALLTESSEINGKILALKTRISGNEGKLAFADVKRALLEEFINVHGITKSIDCIKVFKPFAIALRDALKKDLVDPEEQTKLADLYTHFQKNLLELFKEFMLKAQSHPIQAHLINTLGTHLKAFELKEGDLNYTQQSWEKLIVPFAEALIGIPNIFPKPPQPSLAS